MKFCIAVFSLLGGCAFAQYGSQAKAPGWGLDLALEYQDVYYFRGLVLDDEPGVNTSLTLGVGQVNYNYFNRRGDGENSLEEHNHAVEMTWLLRGAVQTMGYRFYDYQGTRPDTQEIYYRISYQSPWQWTFGTFMDIDAYKGYYFDLSGNRMFPLTRRSLIGLKLYIAGAEGLSEERDRMGTILEHGYFGDNGLTNGYAKLYARYQPTPRWSFEAGYRYHHAFDDVLDEYQLNQENENVLSFKIKYVFP